MEIFAQRSVLLGGIFTQNETGSCLRFDMNRSCGTIRTAAFCIWPFVSSGTKNTQGESGQIACRTKGMSYESCPCDVRGGSFPFRLNAVRTTATDWAEVFVIYILDSNVIEDDK